MKVCTKCGVEKSFSEFYKRSSSKDGFCIWCRACMRAYKRVYTNANADKVRAYNSGWRRNNPQKVKENAARFYQNNSEKVKETVRSFYRANSADKIKYQSEYKKINRDKTNADCAKRRAAKLRASPEWTSDEGIKQYYLIADYLSDFFGMEFNVDHIVPLQSDLVCGLHWEGNFSIMLGAWNIAKGNRWWPDMPECV